MNYKRPASELRRFSFRRLYKGAVLFGLISAAYVASKAQGFASLYPTAADRAQAARLYTNDVAVKALLGTPRQIGTVAGLTLWNTLDILLLVGGVWGILLATKHFRGEEQQGRTELFLAGQTTAQRATIQKLAAIVQGLAVYCLVSGVIIVLIGHRPVVGFGVGAAFLFVLSIALTALVFILLGAISSQLFPTRSQATMSAVAIFIASFMVKAVGSITTYHWLGNVTPFGWAENVESLNSASHPLWLLPLLIASLAEVIILLKLARRDLLASRFADRVRQKPRLRWLSGVLPMSIRLTRGKNLAWLAAVTAMALLYGSLTSTAAEEFSKNSRDLKLVGKITGQAVLNGAKTYLGVVFMLVMVAVMFYVVSAMNAMRADESDGYLDNLLVRPVGRRRWLIDRLLIIIGMLAVLLGATFGAVSLGLAGHHLGVHGGDLLAAGANMLVPAVFVMGLMTMVYGKWPRRLALAGYSVVGWSFLLAMLGSGLKLNHWLMDTSLLHQVALAPAVSPNWQVDAVLTGLGLIMLLNGLIWFGKRDIQGE